MLCFSRDMEISQSIQMDFANISKSKQYEGPPSGIVPFHGICMFGIEFLITLKLHFSKNFIIQMMNFVCCSRTILLYIRYSGAFIFYISGILYSLLPSIDNN